MKDRTYSKSQNALEQIVARGGKPVVICPRGIKLAAGGVNIRTIEVPQLVDCLQVCVFYGAHTYIYIYIYIIYVYLL